MDGNFEKDLVRYTEAGLPILYVDTYEDDEACATIYKLCSKYERGIIEWSLMGVKNIPFESDLIDTLKILLDDAKNLENKTLILRDAHFFLDKPEIIAALKKIAQDINVGIYECNVCIVSPLVSLPKELEHYTTILELDFLTENDIQKIIVDTVQRQNIRFPTKDLIEELATRLKGLSRTEIDSILALAISIDGELNRSDLPRILAHKQQAVKKSGILEMIPVKESMDDIGGLEILKMWLNRKAKIFNSIDKAKSFGVDIPKGVLIAGMPGCGKSLTAKAAAKSFGVPLLRMDMGRLMGKYVGESESNMRRAIKLTEASSPCVLWIDELEKAFAGMGANGGSEVTTRLFGNFLTWMQEKHSLAFVVATANKIDALPPELLRKGRFDEIFYVGLPNPEERRKILRIHIEKRRPKDLALVDLDKLIAETEGYCGADLESIIKDAIESAFVAKKKYLTTEDILRAISETHSLSEVMRDSIESMQKMYQNLKLKSASI